MPPTTPPHDPDDHSNNDTDDDTDDDSDTTTIDDYLTDDHDDDSDDYNLDADTNDTEPHHDHAAPPDNSAAADPEKYCTAHIPDTAGPHGAHRAHRNTIQHDLPESRVAVNDNAVAARQRRDHRDQDTDPPAYTPADDLSTATAPHILVAAANDTDGCDPRDAIAVAYTAARTRSEWSDDDATRGPFACAESRSDNQAVLAYRVSKATWHTCVDTADIAPDSVRSVASAHQRCAQRIADADTHYNPDADADDGAGDGNGAGGSSSAYGVQRGAPVVCLPAPF